MHIEIMHTYIHLDEKRERTRGNRGSDKREINSTFSQIKQKKTGFVLVFSLSLFRFSIYILH